MKDEKGSKNESTTTANVAAYPRGFFDTNPPKTQSDLKDLVKREKNNGMRGIYVMPVYPVS